MRIVSRSGEDGVTVPKIYEQMKSKKNLLRLGTKEAKISDVEDCVFALICDSNLIPVADSEPHEVAVNSFFIVILNLYWNSSCKMKKSFKNCNRVI